MTPEQHEIVQLKITIAKLRSEFRSDVPGESERLRELEAENERLRCALLRAEALLVSYRYRWDGKVCAAKRRPVAPSVRLQVFTICDRRCFYCDVSLTVETLTIDHVLPVDRGGSNSLNNFVAACAACNTKKGNRAPTDDELDRVAALHFRKRRGKYARSGEIVSIAPALDRWALAGAPS